MMMISYGERSQHWNDQEVSDLISIWSQDDVQGVLDGTRRNSNAFSLISERLALKGIHRSPAQVRDKIKTLKRDYRTVRSLSDPQKRRAFRFYNQLDAVLSNRQRTNSNTVNNNTGSVCSPRILSITCGEDAVGTAEGPEESLDTVSSKDSDDVIDEMEPQVILDEHPTPNSYHHHFQTIKCEMPSPNNTTATSNNSDPTLMLNPQTRQSDDSRHAVSFSTAQSTTTGAGSADRSHRNSVGGGKSNKDNSSLPVANLESIVDRFVAAQKEIVSKFVSMEEARMKQECLLEEKRHAREMAMLERMMDYEQRRRREEREHEMKIFGMLSQFMGSLQGRTSSSTHSGGHSTNEQGPSSTSVRGTKSKEDAQTTDS